MKRQTSLSAAVLVLVVPSLVACLTSRSPSAKRVQEADAAMVAGCTFLGEVSGTSGLGGVNASTGIENAKTEALGQAVMKGATHIVWNSLIGGEQPSVSGKAYKCPGTPPKAAP